MTKDTETNNIIDIDLSAARKKKYRIDGDNNRILELNTSDMSIIERLEPAYKKLNKLMSDAVNLLGTQEESDDTMQDINKVSEALKTIDEKMRNLLDELFDSNVSEVCAPYGTMYDPFNGEFRFEHIIKVLLELYESNFVDEFAKMMKRMDKHTAKYTKKKKK